MKQSTIQYMRSLAKLYGAQITFKANKLNVGDDYGFDNGGIYDSDKMRITIYGVDHFNTDQIVSAFCHELGHHVNKLNNKFYYYHNNDSSFTNNLSIKLNYAFRAEQYTDKIGRQLCKIWFPNTKYIATYLTHPRGTFKAMRKTFYLFYG